VAISNALHRDGRYAIPQYDPAFKKGILYEFDECPTVKYMRSRTASMRNFLSLMTSAGMAGAPHDRLRSQMGRERVVLPA